MQSTPSAPTSAIALDDLYEIPKFAQAFPDKLTVQMLRWQLRHREENGLGRSGACIKLGKKLLISRTRYELWLGTRASIGA